MHNAYKHVAHMSRETGGSQSLSLRRYAGLRYNAPLFALMRKGLLLPTQQQALAEFCWQDSAGPANASRNTWS